MQRQRNSSFTAQWSDYISGFTKCHMKYALAFNPEEVPSIS